MSPFAEEFVKLAQDGVVKTALIERLVRLGATDIPRTPRLFMRRRSPAELGALQRNVQNWWGSKVTNPIMGVAEKGIGKLPPGKLQTATRSVARSIAEDPVGMLATKPIPIPGIQFAYVAGKKGLERVIDKVVPVPL